MTAQKANASGEEAAASGPEEQKSDTAVRDEYMRALYGESNQKDEKI